MTDFIDDSTDISSFTVTSNACPPLDPVEERELLLKVQGYPDTRDSVKAMRKLISHNSRLCIKEAKRYLFHSGVTSGRGLTYQDLIQEAYDGLFFAITRFDITKTHNEKFLKLSTYATWWIRQRISRAIADKSRMIRIPVNICGEYTIVQKLYSQYAEANDGRRPDTDELFKIYQQAMEIEQQRIWDDVAKGKKPKKAKLKPKTAKEIAELGRMFAPVSYLHEPNSEDENLTLLDYLCEDEEKQPDSLLEGVQIQESVKVLLECLTPEERHFVNIKFGFIDKARDRRTVAAIKKMTDAQIEEWEANVLKKMKAYADEKGISFDFGLPTEEEDDAD